MFVWMEVREEEHLPLLVVRKPLSFSGESIPRVSCSRTSLNRRRDGVRNTKPPWGSNPHNSSTRASTIEEAHTSDHLLLLHLRPVMGASVRTHMHTTLTSLQ
ncbi:hypothetical protein AVEN_248644-1 [Araneus ventricosus]|uniref:Uncharacterized protein n=1 Tax=Araneus ventricosus TaxID=182803 RepID=A0A4Y2BZQ2_ARAVE|nr:hypothetical protein AVEN_248644-1 [Araneus ventricosus]